MQTVCANYTNNLNISIEYGPVKWFVQTVYVNSGTICANPLFMDLSNNGSAEINRLICILVIETEEIPSRSRGRVTFFVLTVPVKLGCQLHTI